jgi:hypothetical protein
MHLDKFSFGTLRIDGSTYERDVGSTAEKSAKARRHLPGNSLTSLGIRPCPSKERYPGNAAGL